MILIVSLAPSAFAKETDFDYKLTVTDENGREVKNLRSLPAGAVIHVEVEIQRPEIDETTYTLYGLEFRLYDIGLEYNRDGATYRDGTSVVETEYIFVDSVGFAYYDLDRVGMKVNNPMLATSWSYTVTDPASVNLTVPVALMYIPEEEGRELHGNATLYLDPNGGEIVGEDVSGEYKSGTVVVLPDASFGDHKFLGWTDGQKTYPAGAEFTVSGIVTLTATWEGVVKNRQIIFDPNGGEPLGDKDPGGMYADGEKIILPTTTRDGYRLVGWNDGTDTYEPGSEYTVTNSVVLRAVWEEIGGEGPDKSDGSSPNIALILGIIAGAIALVGCGWWMIILWKRRWVLYSLKTGDIALYFKDKKHTVRVAVVLKDDDKEYLLGRSGAVKAGNKLRFIYGGGNVVEDIESGKYKGILLISGEDFKDGRKCRIKVLDREIRERKNDE